ncbi:hypothetical protein TNCV_79841 [Trichonephila clavipes]|nr:hypothetical protein TNCV_79841 [Trichonephila clavipes]
MFHLNKRDLVLRCRVINRSRLKSAQDPDCSLFFQKLLFALPKQLLQRLYLQSIAFAKQLCSTIDFWVEEYKEDRTKSRCGYPKAQSTEKEKLLLCVIREN